MVNSIKIQFLWIGGILGGSFCLFEKFTFWDLRCFVFVWYSLLVCGVNIVIMGLWFYVLFGKNNFDC